MEEIVSNIEKIEILLVETLSIIDSLKEETFDEQIKAAQFKVDEATLIKKMLENRFPAEEIGPFKEKYMILAKQIEKKFDNIIKKKSLEKEKVSKEIEHLINKKNLQNYRR
jgi:hypothetical protein